MAQIIEINNPFEPFKDTVTHEHPGGLTIRGWLEYQYPGFKEFTRPTYCLVNGQPKLRAEWTEYVIRPDDVVNFVVIPGDPYTLLYILYAVLVVATIAIALSLPKPGTPTDSNPDPVYDLKGQRNQNRLSNPIEVPYGRCRLFPSYAARPYNAYIGNQQYQYSLFCLGQGVYDIEAIQFEDTLISNFEDVTYEIYEPGEPATMFPDNVVTSSEVGGIELFGTNETEFAIAGPFAANDAGTQTDLLQVDITFPLGLYYGKTDGTLGLQGTAVTFEYREIDDAGAPVGAGTWLTLSAFFQALKTTTPQRFTLEKSVPPGRYEVRGYRPDEKNLNPRAGNTVRWDALRAFLPSVQVYPDVTLIAVKARATNNLNDNSAQRFNVWATRKLPIYDLETETWSAPTATRNPVWAFCDCFRALYGAQLSDSFLALDELVAFAETFTSEGRNFDFVFDQRSTVWDTATIIARVCRARPMLNGSQITMVRDVPKTLPTAVFTPFNIVKGSFKWEIKMANVGDYDGVQIEYVDPVTWKQEHVDCLVDDDAGDDLELIKLAGCTDRQIAYEEGMYIRRQRRLLRENITFQTELEGHLPSYGDLIRVSHDLPLWGTTGLVRSISGTTVVLSEPVDFTGGSKVIGFRKKDGSESGPHACTAGADAYTITLGAPVADSFFFDGIHELPLFYFGTAADCGRLCSVVGLEPSDDDKVTVKAVVYNGAIFDGGTAPPISNNGTPNSPTLPQLNCSSLVAAWDPITPNKVQVSWAPAVGATQYRVEKSTDGDVWDIVGVTPLFYLTVDAADGEDFYFKITPIGVGNVTGISCEKFLEAFTSPIPKDRPPHYTDLWPPYFAGVVEFWHVEKGGTTGLIGKNEYVGYESTPPKRYRTVTLSGSFHIASGGPAVGGLCPGTVTGNQWSTFYGSNTWDRLTGAYTQGAKTHLIVDYLAINREDDISSTQNSPAHSSADDADPNLWNWTHSSTTEIQTPTGYCHFFGVAWVNDEGEGVTTTLSDEDTEDDAIDRVLATDYGDWAPCCPMSGPCFPCGLSKWSIRETGFTFEYIPGKFKAAGNGFAGDGTYLMHVKFTRKDLTTEVVDEFEQNFALTADGDGNIDVEISIPIERGFEIKVAEAPTFLSAPASLGFVFPEE